VATKGSQQDATNLDNSNDDDRISNGWTGSVQDVEDNAHGDVADVAQLIVGDESQPLRRNLDDSYLLSMFISETGSTHVDILYNLHSGILNVEINEDGDVITISHGFCPTFHYLKNLKEKIIYNPKWKKDDDNNQRFIKLHEIL